MLNFSSKEKLQQMIFEELSQVFLRQPYQRITYPFHVCLIILRDYNPYTSKFERKNIMAQKRKKMLQLKIWKAYNTWLSRKSQDFCNYKCFKCRKYSKRWPEKRSAFFWNNKKNLIIFLSFISFIPKNIFCESTFIIKYI